MHERQDDQTGARRSRVPRPSLGQRGFTMVELMVSVALLGLVSVVIWGLFNSTSNAMLEADSMADTLDKARFSLEQLSADVRSAGAYGSPDSDNDPWALPRDNNRRVVGLATYNGWQNDTSLYPGDDDFKDAHNAGSGDLKIGFDGFIVIGAIDYSTPFELRNMQFVGGGGAVPGFARGASIPLESVGGGNRFAERGLKKLIINDPFYKETGVFGKTVSEVENNADVLIEPVTDGMNSRLLRVMDRQGYVQFGAFADDDISYSSGSGVDLTFVSPGLETKIAGRPFGLQPPSENTEDVGYEATLIDAYWYRVIQDTEDRTNYQLVRQRLDADELTQRLANGAWSSITTSTLESNDLQPKDSSGQAQTRRTVIADRVVDFQFWVDCAQDAGNVRNTSWSSGWQAPNEGDAGHDCLNPTGPQPGRARMAHVRLSIRTEHERRELGHQAFLNSDGDQDLNQPLQTYDVNPDSPGATRVVTVQSDIELTNFSYKNITN